MLLDNLERRIPARFGAIANIDNRLTREHLARMVCDIDVVARELSDTEVDPKVKSLFDRYMEYLEKSCSRRHVLNQRSAWLLTYGNIVLHQMNAFRISTIVNDPADSKTERSQFADKFFEVVNKLSRLERTFVPKGTDYLGFIIATTHRIIDRLTTGNTTYSSVQIKLLFDHLERIDTKVERSLTLGRHATDDAFLDLHNEMCRLEQKVKYHRTRGILSH